MDAKAIDSFAWDERRLEALTARLAEKHGIADRRELLQTIQVAITVYFTTLKASEWPPEPLTLDKIVESAEDLIELLADENNRAAHAIARDPLQKSFNRPKCTVRLFLRCSDSTDMRNGCSGGVGGDFDGALYLWSIINLSQIQAVRNPLK